MKISGLVRVAVTEEVPMAVRTSSAHVSRGHVVSGGHVVSRGHVVSSSRSQDGWAVVVSGAGVKVRPIIGVVRIPVLVEGLGVSNKVRGNTGSRP